MKQKTITIIFAAVTVLFAVKANSASAATYFITNSGAGTHAGTSPENAMTVIEHNGKSFSPGDTIFVVGKTTGSKPIIVPSSGATENYITYRGDYPGNPGSLEQPLTGTGSAYAMIHIKNKQFIKIQDLAFLSNVIEDGETSRAAVHVEEYYEETGHVSVDRCNFLETGNGILLQGDVRYANVTRSIFKNMINNGVAVYDYWNRTDTTHPSFVTIGGSRENGNTFLNVGREDTPTPGSVPGQPVGTQVSDLIFSYNHIYADEPEWGTGIYLNGVSRVLVEYNYIHDLDAMHRRPSITFKTDFDWMNEDIVVRFNHIGPSHGGGTYVTPDYAICVGHGLRNAVIYGNYISNVEGQIPIEANWGWDETGASDGKMVENVFIYSNIINNAVDNSGIVLSGTSLGTDQMINVHIANNTIYKAASEATQNTVYENAISVEMGDNRYNGLDVRNNILDTTSDAANSHIGIRVPAQSDLTIDHNHHYFPNATPQVYFEGSNCKPCAWNSSSRPAGYGTHDSEGDPKYVSVASDNFALASGSPCIDSGETLNFSIPSFQIQGKNYSFDIADGLDPSKTDWNQTIPVVSTLKQGDYGSGWEKGAYVYNSINLKPSDINSDSRVNVIDLGILMSDFGKSAGSALNPKSDINSDGIVNVQDLGMMMSEWGQS